MKQSAITVVAELAVGCDVAAVRARLGHLQASTASDAVQAALFGEACSDCKMKDVYARCPRCERRIHFLSVFVFPDCGPDATSAPADVPGFVVLEVNADGCARAARRLLAERVPRLLEQLFGDCVNRPNCGPDAGARARTRAWCSFLRRHDVGADAFYVANPGRSVEQVAVERSLRERATAELAMATRAVDCTSTWRGIQQRMDHEIRAARPAPRLPLRVRWGTHHKGMAQQLRAYGRVLGWLLSRLLLLVAFGCGLRWAWSLPQPWGPLSLPLPWLISALWMLPVWLRERPVHASPRRRRASWLIFGRAWFRAGALLGAWLGLIPMVMLLGRVPVEHYQTLVWYAAAAAPAALGLLTVGLVSVFAGLACGRLCGHATALLASLAWLAFSASDWAQPHRLWMVWALGTAIGLVSGLGYTAWLLARVRRAEDADRELEVEYDVARLERNTCREDLGSQNHLATVTELRPGWIRRYALQVVLRAVSLLATVHFNQGALDGISSIHFARFVIYSHAGRHWLLFMGNYDGGFSAYLGAFSPVPGTSAVWSCTEGFPRTLGLIWDGARDEQRFKAFGRSSQVQTLGWFSAYPTLSTQDVAFGTATRVALNRAPARRGARLWERLASLRERFAPSRRLPPGAFEVELRGPFDEAACDAAVRRL